MPKAPATPKRFPFLQKVMIAVVGFTVLLIGIAMIILPGPAFIVIPLGLAILATEFLWARRLLVPIRRFIRRQKTKLKARRAARVERS